MSHLLIVEDSRTQAEELRLILEAEDFTVEVAPDGQQALDLIAASAFDLVISDVVMPRLTGYDLCRRIKDDPARRHLPVLLLTSLNDAEDIIRGLECGADNFVTKPFQADYLVDRVRALLANRNSRTDSKLRLGAEVFFLGRRLTVTADREQILGLLLTTFEEIIRANRELQASREELRAAKAQVERYARLLEGQVRSSEGKYQRLMERANDAIFILDLHGTMLEVNRRAEEMLGRPAAMIVGRCYDRFVPASELDTERGQFQKLLNVGDARRDNARLSRADGKMVCVDYTASVVDIDGERVILAIVHDATERSRLEQQLRQAQKMEAVGRLAGGVAHDFNNLLTVISGYSEILLSKPSQDPAARRPVEEIKKAGERAAGLTRQLLAFSRQQVIAPRVLDLNALVGEATSMLGRLIGEDIDVSRALDPALGRVEADPGQVEQVLLNPAVNARDAMPTGGKLTIETANVELDEAYAQAHPEVRAGRYVLLAVTDTGCGMDEATQARIFEPFFTTKEQGKGTGLGLATVYGIVKQAGGYVYVYSDPGRGTCFKVYLPRVEAAVSAAQPRAEVAPSPRGTETLLLVEDDAAVRALTSRALREWGYTVLETGHANEAIRLCEEHAGSIHLLATDVVMPQMGGRELADRLTAGRPKMRVLYLSGYTDDAIVRHGILRAEVAFLQKPFALAALARKVREVLDRESRPPVSSGTTGCVATGCAGEMRGQGVGFPFQEQTRPSAKAASLHRLS